MDKEMFARTVADLTKDALAKRGIDVEIELSSVIKANDQELTGLCFRREDKAAAPVFYVDEAYELYNGDRYLKEFVEELVEQYGRFGGVSPVQKAEDVDLDRMRDKLGILVLDPDLNQKYLSDKPWMATGDGLALVCDVEMRADGDGAWHAVVTKEHLILSEMDKEELFRTAVINAEKKDPASLTRLDALVGLGAPDNLLEEGNRSGFGKEERPLVLSTGSKLFGSSAMYYPGIQKRIAELLGEGYYALPSSRHEFIIVPDSLEPSREGMLKMVKEANDTVVSIGDKLSDRVFHYDREREKMVGFENPEKSREKDPLSERA